MTTVLLVEPDSHRASRLCPGLEGAGFEVRHVTSSFEALTVIERLRPDVVLTRWETGNMSAPELVSALRQDEALGPLSMVLLVDREHRAAAAAANGTFDLTLGADEYTGASRELGERIRRFLTEKETAADPGADQPEEPEEPDPFSISGHFGLLDLADLVQTVCSRRKSGELSLACGEYMGSVIFESGLVRHARYRGKEGRNAFARLFSELRDCKQAPFKFAPMSAEQVSGTPRTIGEPAQLLLLDIAVAQDERERP